MRTIIGKSRVFEQAIVQMICFHVVSLLLTNGSRLSECVHYVYTLFYEDSNKIRFFGVSSLSSLILARAS